MSGVLKGIKKVFKRVGKIVKKVAPVVLAAAAVYFTAGAAMGLLPAGATAGSAAAGAMGLSGTLGGVVSGAVTQAGYGAVIGGAVAEVSGGDFKEGMQQGAAAGALTGGVMGGVDPSSVGVASAPDVSGAGPSATAAPSANPAPSTPAAPSATSVTPPAATPSATSGGLMKPGGWLERNQTLVGQTVSGLGQGLMAKADNEAASEILKQRRANYGGLDFGSSYRSAAPGSSGQSPDARFGATPSSYEYRFDPKVGRIVRVPVDA